MKSNPFTKYMLCLIGLGISMNSVAQFISGGAGKTILQNSNDKVGIGISNPAFALDVFSSGNASANFKSVSGNSNLIIDRGNSSATSSVSYRTAGSPTWQTGTVGTDNFAIRNIALGSAAMSISASNSNVGIGTTSPAAAMHVQRSSLSDILIKSTGADANLVIDRPGNGMEAVTKYTETGVPQWKTGLMVNGSGAPDYVIKNEINNSDALTINASNNSANFKSDILSFGTNGTCYITQSGFNLNLSAVIPGIGFGTPGNINMAVNSFIGSAGNVGIGTSTPDKAKLMVQGAVGNTIAMFKRSSTSKGVSIVGDWPGIGFNSYVANSTWKSMQAGYGGNISMDPSNGVIYFAITPTAATVADQSISNAYPMAITPDGRVIINSTNYTSTLAVKRVATASDAASFQGTTLFSHFAYGNNEDTYIRGGLASSNIIMADLCNNVGIGTPNPAYKLDVCGTMRAKEVRVATGWCDYVFADDYKLPALSEVETFIKANKHLPDVTPGSVIEGEGLEVGKTSAQMIKKIEELTLYVIDLQKQVNKLKKNKN